MADDEYRPPEEAVSDAPDVADDDEDQENYPQADWEKASGNCPNCGANEVYQIGYMRSPDDYSWHFHCRNCGDEWDS